TEDELEKLMKQLNEHAEKTIKDKVVDAASFISLKLHKKFDEEFRYSQGHVPRVWNSGHDIKKFFKHARDSALEILDLLFLFRLKDPNLDAIHLGIPSIDDPDQAAFKFPSGLDPSLIIIDQTDCMRHYEAFVVKIETAYADAQRAQVYSYSEKLMILDAEFF